MPSHTPEAYARWLAEPSIVVDPDLFHEVPRRRGVGRQVASAAFLALRTVASAGVVGVTLFSIAHADKWLAGGHGSAHASERHAVVMHLTPVTEPSARTPSLALSPANPGVFAASQAQPSVALAATLSPAAHEAEPAVAAPAPARTSDEALRDSLRKGRRLLAQNHLDEAAAAYASVLAERSRHPGALAGMARVWIARGDLQVALNFARTAVESAPAHAVYHVTLADVLRARGETEEADAEYATAERLGQPVDRAAKILPENPF